MVLNSGNMVESPGKLLKHPSAIKLNFLLFFFFFPFLVSFPYSSMWPLLNCFPYEDRDRRSKGDGVMPRLFQAMVINELKPQNTSAASFSSAHFSPSSFILFLHAFPPPSFIPIQGPLVYLSGVLRTFFIRTAASLLVWLLEVLLGSLLTVAYCFPISDKVKN